MLVRALFILIVGSIGALLFYTSLEAADRFGGIAISLLFLFSALVLAHPFYPKWIGSGVEKIEEKILPKSDRAKWALGPAIICWAFSFSVYTSPRTQAPTGRYSFILESIYNAAGNEGIAIISILFGIFFIWLGYPSK